MKPYHFFVGTHLPVWLERTVMPLFVSHTRLAGRKSLPRAICSWNLDSGAFSEIEEHGEFVTSPTDYVAAARRYSGEIGGMGWATIQDWMCEVKALRKTGLTIKEHQRRTIISYLTLKSLAPEMKWVPVLQGYTTDDYKRHVDDYTNAGVDLLGFNPVGLGSICRRQASMEIARLVRSLASQGLKLHGFGVKLLGLALCKDDLVSADSMAWSWAARYSPPLKNHLHMNCANCKVYAELWYRLKVWPLINSKKRIIHEPIQDRLFLDELFTSTEAEGFQEVVNLDCRVA